MDIGILIQHLTAALIFAALGIAILSFCYWLIEKLTPFSVRTEIEEDQNMALSIVIGAFIVGMSIIIAAAIHG